MKNKKEYYRNQATVIINNMKKRNFEAYYVETMEEAKEKILELLGDSKTIGYGGSQTLNNAGMYDFLESKGHHIIRRENYNTKEEKKDLNSQLINCDAFFTSSNAITMEGELVNIDGTSSRVGFLVYGPETVYVVAGMNKVTKDLESAIKRVKNYVAPINAIRLNRDTPCTKCSECMDCYENTICCNTVITRASKIDGRIKVILIGEELGY